MTRFAALAAIAVLAGAPLATPVFADAPAANATTLSLSVEGDAAATPDMATISFGVQTQGKTAAAALQANNARMTAVMAATKPSSVSLVSVSVGSMSRHSGTSSGK